MGLTITTPAATTAVDLATVKLHCRIDGSTEDTLLSAYLAAAENYISNLRNLCLVTTTYKLTLDRFPLETIYLPVTPVQSITSIKYYDTAGTLQTLSASAYQVGNICDHSPAVLVPTGDTYWPDTQDRKKDAVEITFVAGYGAAAVVPKDLIVSILLYVSERYEQREVTGTNIAEVPQAFDALINLRGFGGI